MTDSSIKKQLKKYPWAIRMVRWYHSQRNFFDWRPILKNDGDLWEKYRAESRSGLKVLMGTCVGGHITSTNLESMLAVALTLRGCEVQFLLCDGALKACMGCEIQLHGPISSPSKPISGTSCGICYQPAVRCLQPLRLRLNGLGDHVTDDDKALADKLSRKVDLEKIRYFRLDGIAVGEHAYAGALRFVARGDLENEPHREAILRQYFHASIIACCAIHRFLNRYTPDIAVFNHGIYVPQGILGEVCRKIGVKIANWNPAYRKQCFIFSHSDTYHRTMTSEPTENWRCMQWDKRRDDRLMDYLESRWDARHDWIWFHEKPNLSLQTIASTTGIDFDKPTVGLLTSVMWDAALHYASNAFTSMLEWIFDTIDYFQKRPELQLLIRIHPAEIQGGLPSRQRVASEINRRFPDISNNIFIIPPDSNFSTYAMMLKCDSVLIYNTKTGIELAACGLPVVVAGEAWVRNKGFTFDACSREGYRNILDRLPFEKRLSGDRLILAKKYAYHFFFRRMIPLSCTTEVKGNPPYKITLAHFAELMPGVCQGLDTICDGIIRGREFIYSNSTDDPRRNRIGSFPEMEAK
jgi:hypothetical protein